MQEVWKDVVGYEGLYMVSNLGQVKRLGGTPRCIEDRIRKLSVNKRGYNVCVLSRNADDHKCAFVHRLVAEAFIPNPQNLPYINHKDEIKTNNVVDNLEWCTMAYNDNYGTRNERVRDKNSKPVGRYSLDGELLSVYKSAREAQDIDGFNCGGIYNCIAGRTHTSGKYLWRYL